MRSSGRYCSDCCDFFVSKAFKGTNGGEHGLGFEAITKVDDADAFAAVETFFKGLAEEGLAVEQRRGKTDSAAGESGSRQVKDEWCGIYAFTLDFVTFRTTEQTGKKEQSEQSVQAAVQCGMREKEGESDRQS